MRVNIKEFSHMGEMHFHLSGRVEDTKMLKRLELLIGKVMTTVNELAEKLNLVNDQLNKAKEEIVNQVAALQAALENVELPENALAALAALESTAQVLDDLNEDVVVDPEVPAEDQPQG